MGVASLSLPLVLLLALPFIALIAGIHPTEWLRAVQTPTALQALGLTIRTTTLSTAMCVVFGLPVAVLLARHRFPGHSVIDAIVDLPISVPPVVVGVALLLAFGRAGLIGKHFHAVGIDIGFTTMAVVIAQIAIAAPYFVKSARAGIEAIDIRLEGAARTLGANPWRTFWTVTFPLIRPAMLAGTFLAWARALSEFGATMMFAGNFPGRTQTLPLAVMSAFETDLQTAIAVSTLSLALSVVALGAAKLASRTWTIA